MRAVNSRLGMTGLALILMAGLSAPVLAQDANADIDFGDDTSQWANDGECDDPRFTGEGAAAELEDADRGKDATDCRTAFEAGTVTLVDEPAAAPAAPSTPADPGTPTAPAVPASTSSEIDFGDDTSEWANDGECDDPRFAGTGMAVDLEDTDIAHDATDCRTLFEAGSITLAEPDEGDAAATEPVSTRPEDIDFGDDSS